MPDYVENLNSWNKNYDWSTAGEEWSKGWGNSEAQWFFSIYPRIHRFLPANSILEIGPGFGRWTHFLLQYCDSFTGLDISEKCIKHCREVFQMNGVLFCVNDGKSLQHIDDNGIDFIFSFDSLVHAEMDIIEAYIAECLSKLNDQGVAFIHHSNIASIQHIERLEPSVRTHWRANTVSAEKVKECVSKNGGSILCQELINWGCNELIDCFSIFARCSDDRMIDLRFENSNFMQEAQLIKGLSLLYCTKR